MAKTIAHICAHLARSGAEYPAGSPQDRWPTLHELEAEIAADEERERMRVAVLIAEWRQLRREGVMAGSQARRVAEMRAELLCAGCWREIYEETR